MPIPRSDIEHVSRMFRGRSRQAVRSLCVQVIQALGLSFLVSTIALGLGLIASGALRPSIVGSSLVAPPPTLAGMLLGQWLRLRTTEQTFRRVFFAGLLLLGAYIALRSF